MLVRAGALPAHFTLVIFEIGSCFFAPGQCGPGTILPLMLPAVAGMTSAPHKDFSAEMRVSAQFRLAPILLVSGSQVTRITGVSH
jgi:hypothetical protein